MQAVENRVIPGAPGNAPKNQWYVAAFAQELTAEKPLSRKIMNEDICFFRTEGGKVAALVDRCAHRATTLSTGKVIGDTIQCFYHGIQFDAAGRCTVIPSQATIPSQMAVRSFPVVEKGPFIWIWIGDAKLANPNDILDYAKFKLDGSAFNEQIFFRMGLDANYQLLMENLLDTSHISILHAGNFDSGAICRATPRMEVGPDYIMVEREVEELLTGMFAANFELPEGRYRRILRSEVWAPGFCVVSNFFWNLDTPDSKPFYHIGIMPATPENDSSCHYFTVVVKSHGQTCPESVLQLVWNIFLTDKAAIEASQRAYNQLKFDTPDVSVAADAAAVRYRRLVADQVARV